MENWSSKRVPAKYRYLQKHIDEIWKLRKKLPGFSPDFSGLRPEERDLVETFFGCMLLVIREKKSENGIEYLKNTPSSIDEDAFLAKLKEYLTDEEIDKARQIFHEAPLTIYRGRENVWSREDRPNLLLFLEQQQSIVEWLPQRGHLNDKNLTWTSWEELINILKNYGYDRNNDEISQTKSLNYLKNEEKKIIVRIYLEMIDSKQLLNAFNALIKDPKKKYILRKRISIFCRR